MNAPFPENIRTERLTLRTPTVENGASARVMEKAGMEREGRLRRYIRHPNLGDLPRDVFLHSYIRPPKA